MGSGCNVHVPHGNDNQCGRNQCIGGHQFPEQFGRNHANHFCQYNNYCGQTWSTLLNRSNARVLGRVQVNSTQLRNAIYDTIAIIIIIIIYSNASSYEYLLNSFIDRD